MTGNAAIYIYALNPQPLTQAMLEQIIQHKDKPSISKVGDGFVVEWEANGRTITINSMPKAAMPNHLQGLLGFAQQTGASAMIERIQRTQQAFGIILEPGSESSSYAKSVILGLANALDGIFFVYKGVYDKTSRLLFGISGTPLVFFRESPPETERSLARKQRSISMLRKESVPYLDSLPVIVDEQNANIRSKEAVAQRALALYFVAGISFGLDKSRFFESLNIFGIQQALTPKEQKFIQNPTEVSMPVFSWRVESFWALIWALGFVETLARPDAPCSPEQSVRIIDKYNTGEKFLNQANLRSATEILDVLDLTYRYNWALRTAILNGQQPPTNLNPIVLFERQYALSWLVGDLDLDWDDIQTDT